MKIYGMSGPEKRAFDMLQLAGLVPGEIVRDELTPDQLRAIMDNANDSIMNLLALQRRASKELYVKELERGNDLLHKNIQGA